MMASIDSDVQAQCLDFIREIKSAHEKQNDLLERLVSIMADSTVKSEPDKKVEDTSSNNSMSTSVGATQNQVESNDGEASSSGSDATSGVSKAAREDSRLASIRQFMPESYTKRLRLFSIADDALRTPTLETAPPRPSFVSGKKIIPLQSNFSPRIPEDRKLVACLVDSWKYWYPISQSTNPDTSTDVSPVPDFMPWWQFTRGREQNWYHIDDTDHEHPMPWQEMPQGSNANDVNSDADVANYGSSHQIDYITILSPEKNYVVEVPYSYLPGLRSFSSEWSRERRGVLKNPSSPEPGFNKSERENIRRSLGDLYAAPQDGRIPLAFHTSELRLKLRQHVADDEMDQCLDTQLEHTRSLLNALSHFDIIDITARGGTNNAVYRGWCGVLPSQIEDLSSSIQGPTCCAMVQPALQREGSGFVVRPSRIVCRRFSPIYDGGRWCRVIKLDGLATAVAGKFEGRITEATARRVWGRLFNDHRMFDSSGLRKTMDRHLFCRPSARGLRGSIEDSFKGLHFSWYRLCDEPIDETTRKSTWKTGRLYGSKDLFIEQRAFTISYFGSDEAAIVNALGPDGAPGCFWTLLVLDWPFGLSSHFNFEPIEGLEYRAEDIMLTAIRESLREVAGNWDNVRAALGSIVDPEPQFLDPEEHDNLLFDDDTFSRSREYFWIVSCLESFQAHIDDTIEEWEDFHKNWSSMTMGISLYHFRGQDKSPEELKEEVLGEINAEIDRLKDISESFKSSREKTKALREGLFSASGVIESRVSTRLGENVKLLTYVSIFYLPLSFCVALWSTNENYARPMLVVTSVLVAAATFIVVANLRNMTSICSKAYHGVKKPIVERMHDSHDDDWVQKGKGFDSYRPLRQEVVPSEWYIPYFLVCSILSSVASWISRQWQSIKDFLIYSLLRRTRTSTNDRNLGRTNSV